MVCFGAWFSAGIVFFLREAISTMFVLFTCFIVSWITVGVFSSGVHIIKVSDVAASSFIVFADLHLSFSVIFLVLVWSVS